MTDLREILSLRQSSLHFFERNQNNSRIMTLRDAFWGHLSSVVYDTRESIGYTCLSYDWLRPSISVTVHSLKWVVEQLCLCRLLVWIVQVQSNVVLPSVAPTLPLSLGDNRPRLRLLLIRLVGYITYSQKKVNIYHYSSRAQYRQFATRIEWVPHSSSVHAISTSQQITSLRNR